MARIRRSLGKLARHAAQRLAPPRDRTATREAMLAGGLLALGVVEARVLLVLMEHADDRGVCWLGGDKIAAAACPQRPSRARQALAKLETLGWLVTVSEGGGQGNATVRQVRCPTPETGDTEAPVSTPSDAQAQKGGQPDPRLQAEQGTTEPGTTRPGTTPPGFATPKGGQPDLQRGDTGAVKGGPCVPPKVHEGTEKVWNARAEQLRVIGRLDADADRRAAAHRVMQSKHPMVRARIAEADTVIDRAVVAAVETGNRKLLQALGLPTDPEPEVLKGGGFGSRGGVADLLDRLRVAVTRVEHDGLRESAQRLLREGDRSPGWCREVEAVLEKVEIDAAARSRQNGRPS